MYIVQGMTSLRHSLHVAGRAAPTKRHSAMTTVASFCAIRRHAAFSSSELLRSAITTADHISGLSPMSTAIRSM